MSEDRYEQSAFCKWCMDHPGPYTFNEETVLREAALASLVESVEAGDITSLDGTQSPLSQKIRQYHGASTFEMNSNWLGSSQNWVCPCCERSKFQISRVGRKGQILAKLVIHHDHMGEAMKSAFHAAFEATGMDVEQIDGLRLVERMGGAFAAYEEILICEDCNNADAEAKKLLASPNHFSFSVGQIRRFIKTAEHCAHVVDREAAVATWNEARASYELRMNLIRAVAHAAATDAHWYEPHARGSEPIPVFGYARRGFEPLLKRWIAVEPLLKALGMNTKVTAPNLARWRLTVPKLGRRLPDNYLAMLRSEEAHGRWWDSLGETWRCPICGRSKHETVYVGDQGKVVFAIKATANRGVWADIPHICNQCESTRMSLKREAVQLAAKDPQTSFGFLRPDELGAIVTGRPHSPHVIRAESAAQLLDVVVERLRAGRDLG